MSRLVLVSMEECERVLFVGYRGGSSVEEIVKCMALSCSISEWVISWEMVKLPGRRFHIPGRNSKFFENPAGTMEPS